SYAAPTYTQFFAEVSVSDNDTRFNHNLANWNIYLIYQALERFNAISGIGNDNGVGSLINNCLAALRQYATGRKATALTTTTLTAGPPTAFFTTEEFKHFFLIGVANTNVFGAQRRQLFQLLFSRQFLTLALCDFCSWSNH